MFLSAKTHTNIKKIIELIKRENNPKFKTVGTWCMIGGVPNVGKSTLINTFRQLSFDLKELPSKAAVSNIHPTTTRYIDFFKINLEPVIYIMDTPGIMPPKIFNNAAGLKLSVCGNIKEKIAGKDTICDFLLFNLNKNKVFDYVSAFELDDKTDDIGKVIGGIQKRYKISDKNMALDYMLKCFKEGKLGKITIDEVIDNDLVISSV
jgi:ribosome biogenesis GTPase A